MVDSYNICTNIRSGNISKPCSRFSRYILLISLSPADAVFNYLFAFSFLLHHSTLLRPLWTTKGKNSIFVILFSSHFVPRPSEQSERTSYVLRCSSYTLYATRYPLFSQHLLPPQNMVIMLGEPVSLVADVLQQLQGRRCPRQTQRNCRFAI